MIRGGKALVQVWLFGALLAAGGSVCRGEAPLSINGALRTVVDYSQDPAEADDLDVAEHLRLEISAPSEPGASFHFYGRTRADLDSDTDYDAALESADHRVFTLYGQYVDLESNFRMRLGRQWIPEVEAVHLDGLRAEVDRDRCGILLFGGRPVSDYSSTDGEKVFGGELAYRPLERTEIRLTGVRNDEDHSIIDDRLALHWDQRFGARFRWDAELALLNHRGHEVRLGFGAFLPGPELEVFGSFYKRLNRIPSPDRDDLESRRYAEYYALLGQSEELERYSLSWLRYFGERLFLRGGFSVIDILGREDPSNRETKRCFLTLGLFDLPIEDLDWSVTGNFVRAEYDSRDSYDLDGETIESRLRGEEETFVISGEVGYEWSRQFRAAVGSSYGDYDFASFIDFEQDYSTNLLTFGREYLVSGMGGRFITRTHFVELRWRPDDRWTLRLLAELDHSEVSANTEADDYGRVKAVATWRF